MLAVAGRHRPSDHPLLRTVLPGDRFTTGDADAPGRRAGDPDGRLLARLAEVVSGVRPSFEARFPEHPGAGTWYHLRVTRGADGTTLVVTHPTDPPPADTVTGLIGREQLEAELAHLLEHRDGPAVVALYHVDLDRFGQLNRAVGRAHADSVLAAAGQRLLAAARGRVTVGRLGNDEFGVVATGLDPTGVHRLGLALLAALRLPFTVGGRRVRVSASIGVATCPPTDDPVRLAEEAETAARAARAAGGDTVRVHDDTARRAERVRLMLADLLDDALLGGGLRIHRQPVVDLTDGTVVGHEALLRWPTPDGWIPPAEAVRVAEESGLIDRLGTWVLREACQVTAAEPGGAWVSVNVSPLQLSPALIDVVREVLADTGLDPGRLVVEVTESALAPDPRRAAVTLAALSRLGCGVAIDDFGTGFSSLALLRQVPAADVLKIDRSFVAGVGRRREETAIVSAVMSLAGALERRVVAEGIESVAQLRALVATGCRLGQGFLLGPPAEQPATGAVPVVAGLRSPADRTPPTPPD